MFYKKNQKKKIIFISSSLHFIDVFLIDFINSIKDKYAITIATNFNSRKIFKKNISILNIPIERKISVFKDFLSLCMLLIHIPKNKTEHVITITPKSTILGIFIKFFFPKIIRVHIYTGITWTNFSGFKRNLFILIDKINIFFSDRVLFDSKQQINFFKINGFKTSKLQLIANGSIKGVDSNKFFRLNNEKINYFKKKFRIPFNKFILLYLGRIDKDKGIDTLINSFQLINDKYRDVCLLIVGKKEINLIGMLNKYPLELINKILIFDHISFPEIILNCSDILCLPSKREGFGNVVIEASACEIPVVGSDIFGLKSSLINGKNGLTFKTGDPNDLFLKIKKLIDNKNLRLKLGKNGRNMVLKNFNHKIIYSSLENLLFEDV